MKKFMKGVVMGCLALMATVTARAQSPVHFGPRLGLSYSKLSFPQGIGKPDGQYITGFNGGVFVRVDLGKWYVQPELYYNEKGSKVSGQEPGTANAYSGNVKLKTLDLPVLLGYKLIDAEVVNLRVMAGPVFSNTLQGSSQVLERITNGNYQINKQNMGFQAGAGIDVGTVTFDARYEGGLNKISSQFGSRPNLFLLTIGLKII